MYFGAAANAHMQALSSQAFRGRVMSIYSILGLGSTVVGGPLVGWLSQRWSPPVAVGVAGTVTIVVATILALRRVSSRPLAVTQAPDLDAAALEGVT